MDKSLERHKWPQLTQEETDNWNEPTTSKEIQLVILSLSTKKNSVPCGFNGESHHTLIFREKRWNEKMLAPQKKSYDKPRHRLLKSRDITLLTKVIRVKAMVFSVSHVWMWELDHKEGWALKNWCFQTLMLEKTLENSWTARRSSQSILKEINPEYSLEGLMLELKLQYFGHLMRRADSLEKTLMLGRIEGRRRRWDVWMALLTQWTWTWGNSGREWRTGKPRVLQSMELQRVGHYLVTEQLLGKSY